MSTTQGGARKRGRRFRLNPEEQQELKDDYDRGAATVDEIAIKFRISKQTLYNVLKRLHSSASQSRTDRTS
jgi:DNA invertase Pin-like site-specific DNA recombinase